jgi:hypothetical protein
LPYGNKVVKNILLHLETVEKYANLNAKN